jgi:hypothetical protein
VTTVEISTGVRHPVGMGSEVLDEERPPGRLESGLRRLGRPVLALRAVDHVGTYAGVLLTLLGGVLLLVAWGKTAGLTNVALQVPFLVSAGCTGLALVAVGLTVVNIAAKADDARKRRAQLAELQAILGELRRVVEEDAR